MLKTCGKADNTAGCGNGDTQFAAGRMMSGKAAEAMAAKEAKPLNK